MDDVVLNKAATIERAVARVREEFGGDPASLENLTKQDSIVLNLQRACEAAIDLAMHLVRLHRLGVPQSTRDAFDALERASIIDADLAIPLRRMVGFRNVAVHDYQRLQLPIVLAIVESGVNDLLAFASVAVRGAGPTNES
jgi:uncharacterized protein YutE (UPF0331/DUF86 family)